MKSWMILLFREETNLIIKESNWPLYKNSKEKISSESKMNGYITVRFLVNCEGKTGMFRVQKMNTDLKETEPDIELGNSLLQFTKSLDG